MLGTVNFLTALQVCSDWSLLTESQVIVLAHFLTASMRTHILWKMLTQQKVKNVKMKTDQNKLHFKINMAVVAGNVADV